MNNDVTSLKNDVIPIDKRHQLYYNAIRVLQTQK